MTLTLLTYIVVKTFLVFAGAWALARTLSRASAAARHLVWAMALGASVLLLAAPLAGPRLALPLLPSAATASADVASTRPVTTGVLIDVEPAPISAVSIAGSSQASVPAGISWRALLMAAWLVGAALGLLRLAAGMLWATWITRRAAPISDPTWTAALDAAAETLGVGARVALLQSERTSVPVTSGILKPTILLPPGWREWPLERTRVALMHELAHVKRRDALVLVLGRVAAALHWFNPLVHVAVARLRIEQEYACDDLVLTTGADAPGYADALLGFAGGVRAETSPAWAMLSMARPSQVAGRVSAILDGRRRRRAVSRRAGFLAAGLACAIVLPLGALELSAADRRPAVPAVDAPSLVRSIPSAAQASGSGVITGRITGRPVSVLLAAQDAAATQGDTLKRFS